MNEAPRDPAVRKDEHPPLVESLRREKETFETEEEIKRKLAELNPAPKEVPVVMKKGVPWWLFLCSHVVVSSAVVFGPRQVGEAVLGVSALALVFTLLVWAVRSSNSRSSSKEGEAAAAAAQLLAIEFDDAHRTYLADFRKHTVFEFFDDRKVIKVSEDFWQHDDPRTCFIHLTDPSYWFCRQHSENPNLKKLVEVYAGLRKLGKLAAGPPAETPGGPPQG